MTKYFKLGLRGKTTLVLGGLISLLLIVTSMASYWQSRDITLSKVLELEQNKSFVLKSTIELQLKNHLQNLLSLRDVPPVQAIMRARANNNIDPISGNSLDDWRQRLEVIFTTFLTNHPEYQQLRFINTAGDELVRSQRSVNGDVTVVAKHELQNKANSLYVSETITLNAGEIYYSDVSLNKEHGAIQVPHLPVLRMATPVLNDSFAVTGVIVMNLSTERLFEGVTSVADGAQRAIVDTDGYYIKNDDISKTFGFDLGIDYKLETEEPYMAEMALILNQFIRYDENENELEGFQKVSISPRDQTRYWLLTFHIPESAVFADVVTSLQKILAFSLLLGLLSIIFIVWLVSKRILTPVVTMATAYDQLKAGNLNVRVDESMVQDEFQSLYSGLNAFAANQQMATTQLTNDVASQTKQLSAVIDNIVDGIITISERGLIESFNPAARRIFGYSNEEVVGKNIKMLMPEPYHGEHDGYLDNYTNTGVRKIIGIGREVIGLHKDGTAFPMELGVSEIRVDNVVHFVGITRDITERRQSELALQHAKLNAEAASQSKSEFLASMSHEIRTPMNGVIGMLHLLSKQPLSKQQQHYAQTAKSSADALLILINDILDVSKIEAGKLDIEVIDFDIHSLFRDLSGTMAPRVHDQGLEFILDISAIKNKMVKGDPGRLRQILINLLGNAIKFTHHGEIVIRASLEDIDGDSDRQQLRCDIIDTGIGIAREQIDQLFEVFTQADSSTTREYGGSGLGLSIVKQLCQLMGGDIYVHSELGNGSQFSFNLNLKRSTVVLPTIPSIEMTGVPTLIVDDNLTNLEVLTGILEQKSMQVSSCHSGQECLDLLAKTTLENGHCPFKIAILDMQMPKMDGAQLAQTIRTNPQYNNMSLVMMTSMGDRGDANYYAEIGFAAYFHKPTIAQDLYDALALVLSDTETAPATKPLLTHHYLNALRDNAGTEATQQQLAQCVNKHILLVEDNAINQLVALGMLEDLGLSVNVVSNGLEAITALQESDETTPYALILMDCQMPVMDGYTATGNIRKGDAGARNRDICIVAMTANAMQGDREKCLLAGMNDYLSKPIDEQLLTDCLVKWMSATSQATDSYGISEETGSIAKTEILVWDQAAFQIRMRNKQDRATKVVQLFLQDMPELVSEFEQYVNNKESAAAINAAHTIKSVAANIGGLELQALCTDMEAMAKKGQSDELFEAWPAFRESFDRLYQCLKTAY